jgi:hypothetical protein
MEESMMVVGSQSYPPHHGGVHTPLQTLSTITEKGVEISYVIGGHTTEGTWAGEAEHTQGFGPTEKILCTGVQQDSKGTDMRKVVTCTASPKLVTLFTENNPAIPPPTIGLLVRMAGLCMEAEECVCFSLLADTILGGLQKVF